MSRHHIPTKDSERYECIVGYDAPLDTFFGQVIDREINARIQRRWQEREAAARAAIAAGQKPEAEDDSDDSEDYFALWIGTSVGEVQSVIALTRALVSFAELSLEMQTALEEDRKREARPATAHQQTMRDFL